MLYRVLTLENNHVCCMQVNYLGHWLLIHELLAGQRHIRSSDNQHHHQKFSHAQADRLQSDQQQPDQRRSSGHGLQQGSEQGARVVMLTSLTYKAGRIRFDDLDAKCSYSGFHRYSDSKLAEVLAVREFAQRMTRSGQITHHASMHHTVQLLRVAT